jgi:transitional endoplasmic reticulum ATPase
MLAAYMAHKAVESGGTFIYVPEAHEIVYALQLARQYQPAVVFCEDIDRVAAGLRTDSVNAIINTLDGVDTKDADIITMLTTNHVENINRAMLRPGRIDIGLSILPPGAEAVQRLIAHYLGTFADKSNDYTDVGKALAGRIPAVIREIVERSKLTFIGRTKMPVGPGCITDLDLMAAIHQYQNEEKLFVEQVVDYRSDVEKAADALGGHLKDIAKDRSAVLHAEDGHLVSASAKMMLDEEFDNSGF